MQNAMDQSPNTGDYTAYGSSSHKVKDLNTDNEIVSKLNMYNDIARLQYRRNASGKEKARSLSSRDASRLTLE